MDRSARVHIVGADDAVRESVCRLLASNDIDAMCHAGVDELLSALATTPAASRPICVLLDVRPSRHRGLALLATLHGRYARLPVIVLSTQGDIRMAVSAMKLGAVDLLADPFDRLQLLDHVQAVLRSPTLQSRAEDAENPATRGQRTLWATLTPREREVFDSIVRGSSNKRCAADLRISVRTVETHRARIMKKLCAHSVVDLVQFGLVLDRMPRRSARPGHR